MAVVTRYFDASGAGAADGTSWANRAALYSGAWSTVITGFAFNGSDSLLCLVNGSHTIGATLSSGSFTVAAPTNLNPLMFHGCDSSGNLLTAPNPDWMSCEPPWDDSSLPVLTTTTNIGILSFASSYLCHCRLMKFTTSAMTTGALVGTNGIMDWCSFAGTANGTSAALCNGGRLSNCIADQNSNQYNNILGGTNTYWSIHNCRAKGVAGTGGNRNCFAATAAVGGSIVGCTATGCGGHGISMGTGAGMTVFCQSNTIANVSGDGIHLTTAASPTGMSWVQRNMITGCGGSGIDGDTEARAIYSRNRLRDNTTANFSNITNTPTDWANYTTDSDDATEYVNAGSGDFRIKYGAAIWSGGYGAGRQDPPAGSGISKSRIFLGT